MSTWQTHDPQFHELEELGAKLSVELGCPIRYPAYDKNMFECKCGITFPLFVVRGGNWDAIRKKHEGGVE